MTEIETLAAKFVEILTANVAKNKTKRLSDVLPYIETALERGMRHDAILAQINACGLQMSMKHYENTLARLRARNNGNLNRRPGANMTTTHIKPAQGNVALSQNVPTRDEAFTYDTSKVIDF